MFTHRITEIPALIDVPLGGDGTVLGPVHIFAQLDRFTVLPEYRNG